MRISPTIKLWIEYAALALVITLPWVVPGFILTMDLVFTPRVPFPQELSNTSILQVVLWLVHYVLPSDVIEKLVLFLILLLSGVGMHYVVLKLKTQRFTEQLQWGAYFAGIFYMFNPFVYARFMTGQWMVLLGYALLPFFVRAVLQLIETPSRKTAIMMAIWICAILSVSLHHSGIMALLLGAAAIAVFAYKREHLKKVYGWAGASIGLAMLVNSYWILPSLFGSTASAVEQFDHSHFEAFRTVGQGTIGAFSEVIRLQGFWAEPLKLFVLPKEIVPAWGLLWVVAWIIIGIGLKALWSSAKVPFMLCCIAAGVAILCAITSLLEWLSELLPLAAGYREPHKFINIVAFAFAVFGAFGVMWIIKKWPRYSVIAIPLLLLLPIVIASPMLWGFAGQLQSRPYPADWASMNSYMAKYTHGDVLFLPWQEYTSFSFVGRIIANPAEKYFDVPVIAGDNPNFKRISPTVPNERKRKITILLKKKEIKKLQELNLKYILLAKDTPDYPAYKYLFKEESLRHIRETNNIVLWEIKETQ